MINRNIAKIIDGKLLSKNLLEKLKNQIRDVRKININFRPSLTIIQVGNRVDSNVYVRNKIRSASEIGIDVNHLKFDSNVKQLDVLSNIEKLNNDLNTHGIIVQLPLDATTNLDTHQIVNKVSYFKDVDGLCDINAGRLSNGVLNDLFIPCTPKGCFELIKSTGISVSGKNVVVIGRSRLIGTPLSNLLKWHDATVTTCHSKTENLESICQQADILIAAVGHAKLVEGDWIKHDAVVIDCGINSLNGKICGDVDFDSAITRASFITPVPGGVGPMTVAMLLSNTVESALRLLNK